MSVRDRTELNVRVKEIVRQLNRTRNQELGNRLSASLAMSNEPAPLFGNLVLALEDVERVPVIEEYELLGEVSELLEYVRIQQNRGAGGLASADASTSEFRISDIESLGKAVMTIVGRLEAARHFDLALGLYNEFRFNYTTSELYGGLKDELEKVSELQEELEIMGVAPLVKAALQYASDVVHAMNNPQPYG
jgi:hypothetical protein